MNVRIRTEWRLVSSPLLPSGYRFTVLSSQDGAAHTACQSCGSSREACKIQGYQDIHCYALKKGGGGIDHWWATYLTLDDELQLTGDLRWQEGIGRGYVLARRLLYEPY